MINLSLSTVLGDVFKRQLMMIYGTEFQRVITRNNSQLHSILIISTDRTITNPHPLDKIHSLEPQDILKQPIKSNLFLDFTETLILRKPLIEILSEKLMVKIIKPQILMPLKNQQSIILVISQTDLSSPVELDQLLTDSEAPESCSDNSTRHATV